MWSIFFFRVTSDPPKGAPGREGARGAGPGWIIYHKKSYDMSILGLWIVSISKIIFIILLEYSETPPLKGAPGGEGLEGLSPTPKYHMTRQFWGFQEWKFQNLHFSLRVPSGTFSQGTRGHIRIQPPCLTQGCPMLESEATLKGK